MTGPEHYREAESCADRCAQASDRGHREDAMAWAALGQIHAILGLAAATALRGDLAHGLPRPDWEEWNGIAGAKPLETPEEPSS